MHTLNKSQRVEASGDHWIITDGSLVRANDGNDYPKDTYFAKGVSARYPTKEAAEMWHLVTGYGIGGLVPMEELPTVEVTVPFHQMLRVLDENGKPVATFCNQNGDMVVNVVDTGHLEVVGAQMLVPPYELA